MAAGISDADGATDDEGDSDVETATEMEMEVLLLGSDCINGFSVGVAEGNDFEEDEIACVCIAGEGKTEKVAALIVLSETPTDVPFIAPLSRTIAFAPAFFFDPSPTGHHLPPSLNFVSQTPMTAIIPKMRSISLHQRRRPSFGLVAPE